MRPQSNRVGYNISLPNHKIASFCNRWKIDELALFGSVLREDFNSSSDIDLLVSFASGTTWSLFDLVKMQDELEKILNRKVDLVERTAVEKSDNYIRRKDMLENAQVIYATR